MKSVVASEPHRLTFHWPVRSRISLTFVGLLFLSVLAHALAFYLFQVIYPSVVTISPPPAQVSILAPTSPENEELLKWIDAEDPAEIANPHEVTPPGLRDVPYKPSFAEVHTAPKGFEEQESDVQFPSARDPLAMINSGFKPGVKIEQTRPAQKSEVRFSGLLGKRKVITQPALILHPSGHKSLDPVKFLTGVDADGRVKYLFFMGSGSEKVQNGSGDPDIDRQAEAHLRGVVFAPGGQGITWGVASYSWGDDAFDVNGSQPNP